MKNKNRILGNLVPFLGLLCVTFLCGCVGNALSSGAQAGLDIGGQVVTAKILADHPDDYAGLAALYPKLPSALSGGMSSYQLGQTVTALSSKGGTSSGSTSVIVNAVDGTVRNAIAAQGGGTSTPALAQAVAQAAIDTWADGMLHALNEFEGAHGLPATPAVQYTVTVTPVAGTTK